MNTVLVLNASWEPLAVVSWRRAVLLVLAEKAEVVEARDVAVRSTRVVIDAPAVVRLVRFVRVPYRRAPVLTNRAVLQRDGFTCAYCGGAARTVDHIVPRSRGGQHHWLNCTAACAACNGAKRNRTPQEASMPLRFEPFVPTGTRALVVAVGVVDAAWEPYLSVA